MTLLHRSAIARMRGARPDGSAPGQTFNLVYTSRNGVAFTWTVENAAAAGYFLDGTPWVVPASGCSLTAASPSPRTAQPGDGYTDGGSAWSGGVVDGWCKNPVDHTVSPFSSNGFQLDGRYVVVGNNGNFTLPLSLAVGDRIVTSKSRLTPAYSGQANYRRAPQDAMAILTVLSSAPVANSYRPSLYGGPETTPPRVLAANVPVISGAPSSGLDMYGSNRSWSWGADPMQGRYYTPGCAFAIHASATTGSENYTTAEWNTNTTTEYAYNWLSRMFGLHMWEIRLNTNATAPNRQAVIDGLVQFAVDVYGYWWGRARRGQAVSMVAPPSGSYVEALQVLLPILAEWLYATGDAHAAKMGDAFYAVTTGTSATIDGVAIDLTTTNRSTQHITTLVKTVTAANRASATVFNDTYPLQAFTSSTITFPTSIDWRTLIPVETTDLNRHQHNFPGQVFRRVVGGTPTGPAHMIIAAASAYNGVGGHWNIYPAFDGGVSEIMHIKFEAGAPEMLAFMAEGIGGYTNHYQGSVGQNPSDITATPPWAGSAFGAIYFYAYGLAQFFYVSATDMTSTYLAGQPMLNLPQFKAMYQALEGRRRRGRLAYEYGGLGGWYPHAAFPAQVIWRKYIFNNNGVPADNWVVPWVEV